MRDSKQAELKAWLARRDLAATKQERDLASIRIAALRRGLRLQTAAEMWDELFHKK
jgi:hypothetical protein